MLALAAPEPELVWRSIPGGMREVTDASIQAWQVWNDDKNEALAHARRKAAARDRRRAAAR